MFAGRAGMAGGILSGGGGISIPQGGVCHAQCGPCAGCAAVHRGVSGQRPGVACGARRAGFWPCCFVRPARRSRSGSRQGWNLRRPSQLPPWQNHRNHRRSPPRNHPSSQPPAPHRSPRRNRKPPRPQPLPYRRGCRRQRPSLTGLSARAAGRDILPLRRAVSKMQRMNQIQPLPPRRRERCPLPLPPAARTRRC